VGGSSGLEVLQGKDTSLFYRDSNPVYPARSLATIQTMLSRQVIRDFCLEV